MCYCSWISTKTRVFIYLFIYFGFFITIFKNNCSSFHVLAKDILYTFFLKKGVLSDSCLVESFLASDALGGFCMNIGSTFLYFFFPSSSFISYNSDLVQFLFVFYFLFLLKLKSYVSEIHHLLKVLFIYFYFPYDSIVQLPRTNLLIIDTNIINFKL